MCVGQLCCLLLPDIVLEGPESGQVPGCLLALDQLVACFQASYAWKSCDKVQIVGLERVHKASDGIVLVLDGGDEIADSLILDVGRYKQGQDELVLERHWTAPLEMELPGQ